MFAIKLWNLNLKKYLNYYKPVISKTKENGEKFKIKFKYKYKWEDEFLQNKIINKIIRILFYNQMKSIKVMSIENRIVKESKMETFIKDNTMIGNTYISGTTKLFRMIKVGLDE